MNINIEYWINYTIINNFVISMNGFNSMTQKLEIIAELITSKLLLIQ